MRHFGSLLQTGADQNLANSQGDQFSSHLLSGTFELEAQHIYISKSISKYWAKQSSQQNSKYKITLDNLESLQTYHQHLLQIQILHSKDQSFTLISMFEKTNLRNFTPGRLQILFELQKIFFQVFLRKQYSSDW